MACRRDKKPSVERLEELTLQTSLAPVAGSPIVSPVAQTTLPIPIIVGLNGHTQGIYNEHQKNPDIGKSYSLRTTGSFRGYGLATVTGWLHSTGFIATGRAFGTLHVELPHGTLTLHLTGPPQAGFAALPTKFSYVITSGTGRFHSRVGDPVGQGTVTVHLIAPATPSALQQTGGVTLVFHPSPVAVA
jgi:hypothetical protein